MTPQDITAPIAAAPAATTTAIPVPPAFAARAMVSGMDAYRALCSDAESDYEGFCAERAREQLSWSKPFSAVLDARDAPFCT